MNKGRIFKPRKKGRMKKMKLELFRVRLLKGSFLICIKILFSFNNNNDNEGK